MDLPLVKNGRGSPSPWLVGRTEPWGACPVGCIGTFLEKVVGVAESMHEGRLRRIDEYYWIKTSPQLVEDIAIPNLLPEMHLREVYANILVLRAHYGTTGLNCRHTYLSPLISQTSGS